MSAQPDIFDPARIMAQFKPEHLEPFNHNLVDGMMVPLFVTQQRVDELKTWKLRPDDTCLCCHLPQVRYICDDQV